MPDEPKPNTGADTKDDKSNAGSSQGGTKPGRGPGEKEAGVAWITVLALYLVVFTLLVIYGLVKIWPVPTPSRENPPTARALATPTPTPAVTPTGTPAQTPSPNQPRTGASQSSPTPSPSPSVSPSASPPASAEPSPVIIFGVQFNLWDEQRLLLLVIFGGALGTLVHCLRSVYWYVGNRGLVKSWMAMYFMMPFAGAALALVFYLVVRGGFFSPQSRFEQTSPFGFAAFSALIGMFSSQAVLKLKEVAEVLLSKPQGGANAKPQETVPATGAAPAASSPTTGGSGKPPTQG